MSAPQVKRQNAKCKMKSFILPFAFFILPLAPAVACPFCTALKPTWSQERESAKVVAIGEAVRSPERGKTEFRLHQAVAGKERIAAATAPVVPTDVDFRPGALALLLARDSAAGAAKSPDLSWSALAANETSLAYFIAAPSLREAQQKRLAYFLRFLEHDEAAIADDAYQEFGHAAYEDVGKLAASLPYDKLRGWLVDRQTPQHRKGFYAIALSFATAEKDRRANIATLEKIIAEPADDLRGGFDGVLGAYLTLKGEPAFDAIEKKYLADAAARDGDVRHVVSALRFYWEYGREIPRSRQRQAMRRLLARPEFAPAAIVDLARWQDWDVVAKIAELYERPKYPQPGTRQAVVAYLVACPSGDAAAALAELRRRDPQAVADAEKAARLGFLRQ
jgi:hypothetical protein